VSTKEEMLDKLFNPRTVAVVGATPKEGKVGNTILKNLLASGTGLLSIYAVNPRYDRIQGLKCYPSLSEIQGDIDLAVIAIPAEGVPNVLEQCAERGVENVVVISAGFKEVGREGAVLESELVRSLRSIN